MANNVYNPYYSPTNTSTGSIELDMRQEMKELLFGSSGEIPKGKVGLLRRMRRDSNGDPIRCPCRDAATDESDRDYYCRSCVGMGWFWDEYKIVYYRNDESIKSVEGTEQDYTSEKFYVEYDKVISPIDYIVEIALDNNGIPIQPIQRLNFYNIIRATHMRADRGRAEFWQIRATYEREWSTWYGVKNRQTV